MLARYRRKHTLKHARHANGCNRIRRSFLAPTLLAAVAVALSWPASDAHALSFDVEGAFTSDSNVTRTQDKQDIEKDQFLSVTAGMTYVQSLNPSNRLIYRGFLRGESYDKFHGLNNTTAGGGLTYQYRDSGAFTDATYGAFVKIADAEYRSDLRDSYLYSVGISWRKPFTDRITFSAVLAANVRDSDSTVFDTKEISLLLNLDYALTERWTMYLTHNYLKGDIVSTTVTPVTSSNATKRLKIVDAADEINIDDVFGVNAISYRLKARTDVLTLGTNFSISEKHSLDVSARWIGSNADNGIDYKRWQFSIAYLARF